MLKFKKEFSLKSAKPRLRRTKNVSEKEAQESSVMDIGFTKHTLFRAVSSRNSRSKQSSSSVNSSNSIRKIQLGASGLLSCQTGGVTSCIKQQDNESINEQISMVSKQSTNNNQTNNPILQLQSSKNNNAAIAHFSTINNNNNTQIPSDNNSMDLVKPQKSENQQQLKTNLVKEHKYSNNTSQYDSQYESRECHFWVGSIVSGFFFSYFYH